MPYVLYVCPSMPYAHTVSTDTSLHQISSYTDSWVRKGHVSFPPCECLTKLMACSFISKRRNSHFHVQRRGPSQQQFSTRLYEEQKDKLDLGKCNFQRKHYNPSQNNKLISITFYSLLSLALLILFCGLQSFVFGNSDWELGNILKKFQFIRHLWVLSV